MIPEVESLCRRAKSDIQKVIDDPLWTLLFIENPDFTSQLPSEFKLDLLRHLHKKWGGFDSVSLEALCSETKAGEQELQRLAALADKLSSITVDLDPWETEWPGVRYSDDDCELNATIKLAGGWKVEFSFANCDVEMKDVEYGCDEKIGLANWLDALFTDCERDIRSFAESQGISYEPSMSPDGGWYTRLAGVLIEHESGAIVEVLPEELKKLFDSDAEIADHLKANNGKIALEDYKRIAQNDQGARPLFSAPPIADDETVRYSDGFNWQLENGHITVTWQCECWLPPPELVTQPLTENTSMAEIVFTRHQIKQTFSCSGCELYDCEICFARWKVIDALEEITKTLEVNELEGLYLYALGLGGTP
jgi:hypothetical protein